MEYQAAWKPGLASLYKGVDPQKVAGEIMDIGASATPAEILEKARDEETELHKCFEWDDTAAAERYRLAQARQVVRLLVIRTEEEEKPAPPVRLFYKTDSSDGYKPTQIILQNRDEYAALLRRAINELTAFRNKYKTLSELETVFEEIDNLAS